MNFDFKSLNNITLINIFHKIQLKNHDFQLNVHLDSRNINKGHHRAQNFQTRVADEDFVGLVVGAAEGFVEHLVEQRRVGQSEVELDRLEDRHSLAALLCSGRLGRVEIEQDRKKIFRESRNFKFVLFNCAALQNQLAKRGLLK